MPLSVVVGQSVECGVLATHADDRGGMWHQVQYAEQLGDGLVLVGDAESGGADLPVVAGEGQLVDPVGATPLEDSPEDGSCLRRNPAEMPLVGVLVDQFAPRVQHDAVDAHRANVDPHRVHCRPRAPVAIAGRSSPRPRGPRPSAQSCRPSIETRIGLQGHVTKRGTAGCGP